MRYLLLMRHANAAFPDPGMKDFDRPLTDLGWSEARATAQDLHEIGILPDRVYCSTARRARETLDAVTPLLTLAPDAIVSVDRLYAGGPSDYVDIAARDDAGDVIMVIGHNPMIEDAALALSVDGDPASISALRDGFPTAGIAVIRLDDGDGGSVDGFLERMIRTRHSH